MNKFLRDVSRYLLDQMTGTDYRKFAASVRDGLDAVAARYGWPVVDLLATAMIEHSKQRREPKHVIGAQCTCAVCRRPDDLRLN